MGAWDDTHDPGLDMLIRLETAELQERLEAAEQRAHDAEVRADFAKEIILEHMDAQAERGQPVRHLRAL